ncbi:MAG: zinc ribbon domain-containing protein [Planctomycetes bacterium]|nr:zinc ribbon domain-containing protein [Planctomycetota bacterium]MBI3833787.1 zinc ribbon domain-containing protein [Planctomycetota bacterium]
MEQPADKVSLELAEMGPDDDLPPGNHALEVAARRGFGPLSSQGKNIWHGEATPCVSCGQLVERGAATCEDCGQDLSDEMVDKMRQHAGPWFVLEHIRPFPGVSLERIVRQIRRGFVTETSIVRGPATDFQWRFAVETPGLCRYFGKCWRCHHGVSATDTYCPNCLSHLAFESTRAADAPRATAAHFPAPMSLDAMMNRTVPPAAAAPPRARTALEPVGSRGGTTQPAAMTTPSSPIPRSGFSREIKPATLPALASLAQALGNIDGPSVEEEEFQRQQSARRWTAIAISIVLVVLLGVLLAVVAWRQKASGQSVTMSECRPTEIRALCT